MKTISDRHRQLAIRAARWALLGALAGAVAWGLAWLYYPPVYHGPVEPPFPSPLPKLILPGLLFGSIAGLELRRKGLANGLQVGLLVAVSILAWVFALGLIRVIRPDLEVGLLLLLLGIVWSAAQVAGTAAILPFARNRLLWPALVAAGGLTAMLVGITVPGNIDHHLELLFGWSG